MSPFVLSGLGLPARGLTRASFALLPALFALAMPAASAHAATITMPVIDPAGDNVGGDASLDFVGGSIVYNQTAGQVTATLTMSAPLPDDTQAAFFIFLRQATSGVCATASDDGGTQTGDLAIAGLVQPDTKQFGAGWGEIGADPSGSGTFTRAGNTITIATNADKAIANQSWNCADIEVRLPTTDSSGPPVDLALAYVSTDPGPSSPGTTPTPTPTQPPAPPVVTTDPDADRDGTPDSADRCAAVPGALANGCPTMPEGMEVRLGAKRVVVDKLVARVAATCASPVRVKVLSKGKPIASGLVTVSQFGSYCRVNGVVRLKHRYAAVRVTMEKTGMAGFQQSAHRA